MEIRLRNLVLVLMVVASALAQWQDDPTCGLQYDGVRAAIVGGEKAEEYEWPWQAAMYRGGRRICGGSLIHPQWIITAAHCVDIIYEPEIFEFRVGSKSLANDTVGTQRLRATEVYVHPGFSTNLDNDIALFKVAAPGYDQWPDYRVNTICLPTEDMDADFVVGGNAVVTGWGALEEGGGTPDELYEVTVPIYDQTACNEAYEGEITDNMICAGRPEGGIDSCQGDSGGPMVALRDGTSDPYYLIGIVSWGTGCAREGYPGVYTRVTQYEDWISPIFDSDPDTNPIAKDGNCTADEFLCRGGECIPDVYRCSGGSQCYYGTDEEFCDGVLKLFDVYYLVRIATADITQTNQPSKQSCADHCVEIGCAAFDVTPEDDEETTFKCDFAMAGFSTIAEANADRTFNHFEIINQENGEVLRQASGIVGSAFFFPGADTTGSRYTWTVNVTSSGKDSLRFTMTTIAGSSSCEELDTDFALVTVTEIQDGVHMAKTSYCLNAAAEGAVFSVHSTQALVEFFTTDADVHGFLMEYETYFDCDREYTIAPGAVMSPNYPSSYPNSVTCNTHLQAPEGQVVYLRFTDMDIEDHPTCRWDSVSLYNGSSADAPLIRTLCGNKIPADLMSVGPDMFIVFSSDGSVPAGGFKASFDFGIAMEPTEDPDIAVIKSLDSELSSFKYGIAAACILGALLIMVIAASLYSVTMRDSLNAEKVAKLEEDLQHFKDHQEREMKRSSDGDENEHAYIDIEAAKITPIPVSGSKGVQATKASIIAETSSYADLKDSLPLIDNEVEEDGVDNEGVVNDGYVEDEGVTKEAEGVAGEAAAVAAVEAAVKDAEAEEHVKEEEPNTTVEVHVH